MKNILFIGAMLLCVQVANAQRFVTNEVDPFTGVRCVVSAFERTGKGADFIYISTFYIGGQTGLYLQAGRDVGCAGVTGNKFMILCTDGTVINCGEDLGQIDCADDATSIYTIDAEKLSGKSIMKLRLEQSNGYIDADWTMNQTLYQFIKFAENAQLP